MRWGTNEHRYKGLHWGTNKMGDQSPFRELAARGTSTNHIAASWMLQAMWLATVASCHIVWQTLLIPL